MEISLDTAIVWTHWRSHYEKDREYLKHKCCCPEYTSDGLNFQASRDKWVLGEYIEHVEGETKGCHFAPPPPPHTHTHTHTHTQAQ